MLNFDDPTWSNLHGGYRVPYDPRPALKSLSEGEDVWEELWQELHHQGDVGEASYASVPHLVQIMADLKVRAVNFYALICTIEIQRHCGENPPLGAHGKSYGEAWDRLRRLAFKDLAEAEDPYMIRSLLATLALWKGERIAGALLACAETTELEEMAEEFGFS